MKKYVVLFMLLCVGMVVMAQDIVSDFQKKTGNVDDCTLVNISSKMFQMMAGAADADTQQVIKNLTGLKILTTEKDMAKNYAVALEMLTNQGKVYEELMSVKDKSENVKMFTRETNGVIKELVILVGGKTDFVLMGFSGKIDLKQIAKLSKSVNVDGLEYLEKMK